MFSNILDRLCDKLSVLRPPRNRKLGFLFTYPQNAGTQKHGKAGLERETHVQADPESRTSLK